MKYESQGSPGTHAMVGDSTALWDSVVDWLAGLDVEEPAAVAVASILEGLHGPPIINVWSRAGGGAANVVAHLRKAGADPSWQWQAGEGIAGMMAVVSRNGGLYDVAQKHTWPDIHVRVTREVSAAAEATLLPSKQEVRVCPVKCGEVGYAASVNKLIGQMVSDKGTREVAARFALAQVATSFSQRRAEIEALLWADGRVA